MVVVGVAAAAAAAVLATMAAAAAAMMELVHSAVYDSILLIYFRMGVLWWWCQNLNRAHVSVFEYFHHFCRQRLHLVPVCEHSNYNPCPFAFYRQQPMNDKCASI